MTKIRVNINNSERKKKHPTQSGMMHKVFVYSNGALLGYGFVIMYADGKMSAPELFDIGGNRLPENAWYEIQMSDEKYSVIVPRNIQ